MTEQGKVTWITIVKKPSESNLNYLFLRVGVGVFSIHGSISRNSEKAEWIDPTRTSTRTSPTNWLSDQCDQCVISFSFFGIGRRERIFPNFTILLDLKVVNYT
jgi:hypothetical protein